MAEKQEKAMPADESAGRISSPEQLSDYLRVTHTGIWVLFTAIILLLVGLFVWASTARLETVAAAKATVESGTARITTVGVTAKAVTAGMTVRVGNDEFTVSSVGEDEQGHAVAYAPVTLVDGRYDAKIVLERIAPISFLIDN